MADERDVAETPKLCTTSGRSVEDVRRDQTAEAGQHRDYIVLCPEERAKGFVRPYRDVYRHVGRVVCGAPKPGDDSGEWECCLPPGHDGDHWGFGRKADHAGCGTETRMGQALSETYARDPFFYGATFCVGCNRHLPVAEFVWTADGQRVGS